MSPRDLAFAALDYIDVATLAAASTRQKERIARDLTATLQEIYSLAPALYKDRKGASIAGPVTASVVVTNGSRSFTSATSMIDGSTILIPGDATYNEVRIDGLTKTLVNPYLGIGGTYVATVWNDSIALDSTVDRVTGNVKLNDTFDLDKRVNRADLTTVRWPEPDYGRRLPRRTGVHRQGQPDSYFVEPRYKPSAGAATQPESTLWMRLHPLPNAIYTLAFDVRLRAPRITAAGLGSDGTDSTVSLVVAADMIEAIVLPLFIKRWSGSPWFRNNEAKKEITEQAERAATLLRQYRPQQQSNRRIVAPL